MYDYSQLPPPLCFVLQVGGTCRFAVICAGCPGGCRDTPPGVFVQSNESVPVCEEVPEGAVELNVGATLEHLELKTGYYRVSERSHNVLECYNEEACEGGVETADESCAEGYKGVCEATVYAKERRDLSWKTTNVNPLYSLAFGSDACISMLCCHLSTAPSIDSV